MVHIAGPAGDRAADLAGGAGAARHVGVAPAPEQGPGEACRRTGPPRLGLRPPRSRGRSTTAAPPAPLPTPPLARPSPRCQRQTGPFTRFYRPRELGLRPLTWHPHSAPLFPARPGPFSGLPRLRGPQIPCSNTPQAAPSRPVIDNPFPPSVPARSPPCLARVPRVWPARVPRAPCTAWTSRRARTRRSPRLAPRVPGCSSPWAVCTVSSRCAGQSRTPWAIAGGRRGAGGGQTGLDPPGTTTRPLPLARPAPRADPRDRQRPCRCHRRRVHRGHPG